MKKRVREKAVDSKMQSKKEGEINRKRKGERVKKEKEKYGERKQKQSEGE